VRSPVFDVLLELIDLQQRVSGPLRSDPLDAVAPVLLLALPVEVGVDDEGAHDGSEGGPPGDNYHGGDAEEHAEASGKLVVVLPLRAPVRRAQEIKEEAGDVDAAIAEQVEDGDEGGYLVDGAETDGEGDEGDGEVEGFADVSFEEVEDPREHVIIGYGIDQDRGVLNGLEGRARAREYDPDVYYPSVGPGELGTHDYREVGERLSGARAGKERKEQDVEADGAEVGPEGALGDRVYGVF